MEEPSLLDYLKEKLNPRRWFDRSEPGNRVPGADNQEKPEGNGQIPLLAKPSGFSSKVPWRSLFSLVLALLAQSQLEPPEPNAIAGAVLYALAAGMLAIAVIKGEIQVDPLRAQEPHPLGRTVRRLPLFFFVPLIVASFISFTGNQFTGLNVTLWIASLATGIWAFWEPEPRVENRSVRERLSAFLKGGEVQLKVDYWKLLMLAVFLVAVWFHFYHLNEIPLNMTSDHTEKLLDIQGVLDGNTQIFFANNGGREPIHFYLSAFLVKVFGAGLNFFTLKLTMTLAFLVSLIYVYRLGNEIGGRWTGLFFMALFGFSAWGNMITRVGLRLVLTPVFVAPVLFYFFRGLRSSRRNDFILAGILLGLGLLGYSAFRLMPVVIVAGVLTYLVYHKFNQNSRSSVWALLLMALFATVLFLPILRFAVDYPDAFGFRTLTRMTGAEQPLPGQVIKIFLSNFWNAAVMPFWKDGSTWVISVTDRPALDVIGAALYFLGLVITFYRWLRYRSWQDLFLLLSIPLLMMPSILSLAFPDENPSLSRAGGAVIPIFLLCAIALKTLLSGWWKHSSSIFSKVCVVVLGLMLLEVSAVQNYQIALVQYPQQYKEATWNSTQMAQVIDDFIELNKEPDNVWIVGVSHWVDTRLVAISAGYIGRDYAVWPQDLEMTLPNEGAKLFIVKFDDLIGMDRLRSLYPQGYSVYHLNEVEGRDFYAYIVPPG